MTDQKKILNIKTLKGDEAQQMITNLKQFSSTHCPDLLAQLNSAQQFLENYVFDMKKCEQSKITNFFW